MPLPIAQAIAKEAKDFPGALLGLAEEMCRREMANQALPVAEIAERQGWFEQPFKQTLFD
jgi:hypothetical protein